MWMRVCVDGKDKGRREEKEGGKTQLDSLFNASLNQVLHTCIVPLTPCVRKRKNKLQKHRGSILHWRTGAPNWSKVLRVVRE